MTRFFKKFKKPFFDPFLVHFPNFEGKKIFSRKYGSVMHNFIWVSSISQNLEKTNDTIPRKRPDRRKNERTDGRTDRPYSIGQPFRLPPGVQKVASVALGTPCSLLSSFTAAIQEQKTECLIQRNLKYVCFVAI